MVPFIVHTLMLYFVNTWKLLSVKFFIIYATLLALLHWNECIPYFLAHKTHRDFFVRNFRKK